MGTLTTHIKHFIRWMQNPCNSRNKHSFCSECLYNLQCMDTFLKFRKISFWPELLIGGPCAGWSRGPKWNYSFASRSYWWLKGHNQNNYGSPAPWRMDWNLDWWRSQSCKLLLEMSQPTVSTYRPRPPRATSAEHFTREFERCRMSNETVSSKDKSATSGQHAQKEAISQKGWRGYQRWLGLYRISALQSRTLWEGYGGNKS